MYGRQQAEDSRLPPALLRLATTHTHNGRPYLACSIWQHEETWTASLARPSYLAFFSRALESQTQTAQRALV